MQVIYQLIETDYTDHRAECYVVHQFNTRKEAEKALKYYRDVDSDKYKREGLYDSYDLSIRTKEVYDSFEDYLLDTIDVKQAKHDRLKWKVEQKENESRNIIDRYDNPLKYKDTNLRKVTEEEYKEAKRFIYGKLYNHLNAKLDDIKRSENDLNKLKRGFQYV